MLTTTSLGRVSFENGWVIHPFSGELLKFDVQSIDLFNGKYCKKIIEALHFCNNPYLLSRNNYIQATDVENEKIDDLSKIFSRLNILGNRRFLLSRIYSSFQTCIFENSAEAMNAINQLPVDVTENRCLQKCLAVAKTSTSFKENGVIFLGAHLPLKEMHAWIIEDGIQPDLEDRSWINFTPLLAIHHNLK